MICVFDTETTGKANFKADPSLPFQPRIVQLGAVLMDDDAKEVASINLIIQPEGFKIPDEAAAIHGITTEIANKRGVKLSLAIGVLFDFLKLSETTVAHNFDYDAFVVTGEFIRLKDYSATLLFTKSYCTMKAMTPICQLPRRYGDYKWPKLIEAHQHAFGEGFEGAHDAMADVRACARLYFWLQKRAREAAGAKEGK